MSLGVAVVRVGFGVGADDAFTPAGMGDSLLGFIDVDGWLGLVCGSKGGESPGSEHARRPGGGRYVQMVN